MLWQRILLNPLPIVTNRSPFWEFCDGSDAQATVNCFVTARATSSGGRPRNVLLDRSEGRHQV